MMNGIKLFFLRKKNYKRCYVIFPESHKDMCEDMGSRIFMKFRLETFPIIYKKRSAKEFMFDINEKLQIANSLIIMGYCQKVSDENCYKLGIAHAHKNQVILINLSPYGKPEKWIPECIKRDFSICIDKGGKDFLEKVDKVLSVLIRGGLFEILYERANYLCDEWEENNDVKLVRNSKTNFQERLKAIGLDRIKQFYFGSRSFPPNYLMQAIVKDQESLTSNFLDSLNDKETSQEASLHSIENPQARSELEVKPMAVFQQMIIKDKKSFRKEVFISYAWLGKSEEITNRIDATLSTTDITLIRDKRELEFKGRIKEFMQQIGQGKAIVVVISDKYLKSESCMFELLEIAENGSFYDRIFPIVLDNAQIYDPIERINYVVHWEEKIQKLDIAMKKVGSANLQGFRDSIDLYTRIRATIADLTDTLKDMNTLTPEIHTDSDFEELINAIKKRLAN